MLLHIFVLYHLDSGASINITNKINILSNINEHEEKTYLANSQYFRSEFIGNFKGHIIPMK